MIDINTANSIIKSQEVEYGRYEALWKECQQYVNPFMGKFTQSGDSETAAKTKPKFATEPSAMGYLEIMAAGLQAGTTSRTRPWFKIATDDEEFNRWPRMAEWTREVSRRMYSAFDKSNFYKCQINGFLELGCFGTAAKEIMPHPKGGIYCRSYTCGEYMISLDEFQQPTLFSRKSWYTAMQLAEEFPVGKLSESVQSALAAKDVNKKFLICQLIMGNKEAKSEFADNLNMPWISYKWEQGQERYLSTSGFRERPVQTPRWWTVSNDTYGVSPSMKLLGRIRLGYKLDEKSIKAIDKLVDPALNAPNAYKNTPHSSRANSIFYTDNPSLGITPQYQVNWDIKAAEYKMDRLKEEIANGYYNKLFTSLLNDQDNPQMTATEVIKTDEEKLAQLGPVLESLHYEDIGPSVERTFQIMMDNGELPPPPPEMKERKLDIEYTSVVAQAQKALNVVSQERFAGFVGNISAVAPDALDIVDWDETIRDYAYQLSIEPDQLNSEQIVAAKREARAKQQQMAQQAETANVNANSAKVLSETDTAREGSALNALLG